MNLVVPIHPWHNGEMLKDSIFAEAPGQNQDDNIRVGMLSMKIQETTSIVIEVYKLYGWFTIRLQRYEMYKMNIYLYIGTLKKKIYIYIYIIFLNKYLSVRISSIIGIGHAKLLNQSVHFVYRCSLRDCVLAQMQRCS